MDEKPTRKVLLHTPEMVRVLRTHVVEENATDPAQAQASPEVGSSTIGSSSAPGLFGSLLQRDEAGNLVRPSDKMSAGNQGGFAPMRRPAPASAQPRSPYAPPVRSLWEEPNLRRTQRVGGL